MWIRPQLLMAVLVLAGLLTSCSDKGVHMPKHRKRRHCDCPTFSLATPPSTLLPSPAEDGTILY